MAIVADMLNCFIYHGAIFQQHRWITITTTANLHTHICA